MGTPRPGRSPDAGTEVWRAVPSGSVLGAVSWRARPALPAEPWTPGEAQHGPATSRLSRNLPPRALQSEHFQKPTTQPGEEKFSLDKLTRMLQSENLGGFLKISS